MAGRPKKILVCWVGQTDLNAAGLGRIQIDGPGPIASGVADREFDRVLLLFNYPEKKTGLGFVAWLRKRTKTKLELQHHALSDPTDFAAIYRATTTALDELRREHTGCELTFHLSPGTPAMAAVWLILANTRYPAALLQSSREQGVREVVIPFQITADFVPEMTRERDSALAALSAELPPNEAAFGDILHRSEVMVRLIARARRAAHSSVPVLIEGGTGTGKELVARAMHQGSPRRGGPFVAVNCGAIPKELVESELFGHVKGAFTGAERARTGVFEQAHGGTLFLDEIGEMPLSAQVRILRVLQEGEVTRVGDTHTRKVDVRIVAATHRSLIEEVADGAFREDLFYRLAVAVLKVPPLRERGDDIGLLIDRLLVAINRENSKLDISDKKLSVGARNVLLGHSWPGNVRELQNTLRRATIWSVKEAISGPEMADALLPTARAVQDGVLGRPLGDGFSLEELKESVERHYVERALAQANGSKTEAARLVGLDNYQTFSNWMKRLAIR